MTTPVVFEHGPDCPGCYAAHYYTPDDWEWLKAQHADPPAHLTAPPVARPKPSPMVHWPGAALAMAALIAFFSVAAAVVVLVLAAVVWVGERLVHRARYRDAREQRRRWQAYQRMHIREQSILAEQRQQLAHRRQHDWHQTNYNRLLNQERREH